MDKSLFIFLLVGVGFFFFITDFIGDIQKEDETFRNDGYNQKQANTKYDSIDSVGQNILNLLGADAKTQVSVWNKNKLREEYILLFPDFGDMKNFIKDRIIGDALKSKLLAQINSIENRFFSGSMTTEQAKQELSSVR